MRSRRKNEERKTASEKLNCERRKKRQSILLDQYERVRTEESDESWRATGESERERQKAI